MADDLATPFDAPLDGMLEAEADKPVPTTPAADPAAPVRRVNAKHTPPRDWRRIHHSPAFWIGVLLCLAAIAIYLWSDDLSWRPRGP